MKPKSKDLSFAVYLKQLRLKAQLSQGDVARYLGYRTSQFVSNWERGLSEPPPSTIPEIARCYGVSQKILMEAYIQFRLNALERELRQRMARYS